MPVAGQLDAIGEALRKIVNEGFGGLTVAPANVPRRNEFRIGIDRRPGPHVASIGRRFLRPRHVLLLAMDEGPDFIDLNALGGEIAEHAVLLFYMVSGA